MGAGRSHYSVGAAGARDHGWYISKLRRCQDVDVAEFASIVGQLADETRLRIIATLAREQAGNGDAAIGFADLRRAVGVDDSGNFSYHLNRLSDRFVVRTDEGYVLTSAGTHVASILISEVCSDTAGDPQSTSFDCAVYSDPVRVQTGSGKVAFECKNGHGLREVWVPAVVLLRGSDDALQQVTNQMYNDLEVAATGTCARCHRAVSWSTDSVPAAQGGVLAVADCTACGMVYSSPLSVWAVADWDVRARIQLAGIDLRELPPCELLNLVATGPERVSVATNRSSDEVIYEISFEPDAGGFTVRIDGQGTVHEIRDGEGTLQTTGAKSRERADEWPLETESS